VPWYIKRERADLIERYNIPLDEYPRRCERQIREWKFLRKSLETPDTPLDMERSVEYGSGIIHSMETGVPRVVYANLENTNLITNLPPGCCVEVPCVVEKNGIQPTHIGALPPHLAALMQTNINVQALTVEALLTGNREHIYHAAVLDPHTGAELDLDQIWQLVDDLIAQHAEWIPHQFRNVETTTGQTQESPAATITVG
jgi:alpha-galactosidase